MRWPWTRAPEVRESSYTNIIQTALTDHALGQHRQATASRNEYAVLACCRLWSAAASSFAVDAC